MKYKDVSEELISEVVEFVNMTVVVVNLHGYAAITSTYKKYPILYINSNTVPEPMLIRAIRCPVVLRVYEYSLWIAEIAGIAKHIVVWNIQIPNNIRVDELCLDKIDRYIPLNIKYVTTYANQIPQLPNHLEHIRIYDQPGEPFIYADYFGLMYNLKSLKITIVQENFRKYKELVNFVSPDVQMIFKGSGIDVGYLSSWNHFKSIRIITDDPIPEVYPDNITFG